MTKSEAIKTQAAEVPEDTGDSAKRFCLTGNFVPVKTKCSADAHSRKVEICR